MARLGLFVVAVAAAALAQLAAAQGGSSSGSNSQSQGSSAGSSSNSNNPSSTANVTSVVTSIPVVTSTSVSGSRTISFTSLSASTIISTLSPRPTSTGNSTNGTTTGHNSTTPHEDTGPVLDTRIGPAFGVLGALLILTGLPSAFLGHKNRWSSFFLTGFYTLSLVCLALILRFGVLVAIHPPTEKLKGLFVLACGVAGIAGGGISIFFWQQTKYFIGAWGGFAIGLWVQCFRNGGLIGPIGFRWIMYSACATVGFVLCTIPKLHYHVMILGTAITGASAFMLGVDCFTTAGLKEFYVYNIGFSALFPKFSGIKFPVSQTMQIEIGLIAAVALAGTAVQLRVLAILKRKLREINEEEKRREAVAEEKAVKRFEHVQRDLDEWEKEHGNDKSKPMSESEMSAIPLMTKEPEESTQEDSTVIGHQRTRTRSGLSEYAVNNDPSRPVSRFSQSPGILPAMNLGLGLDSELPGELVSDDLKYKDPDLAKKEELLAEIQTIRKSIDALRSDTGSASGESRRPSTSLHSRTLSGDLAAVAEARARTISRGGPSRDRVHSMNILDSPFEDRAGRAVQGAAIGRPVSAPLDDDWEAYVRERKLFQPPAGPSAPIAPTYVTPIPQPAPVFQPVSDAVAQVLAGRKQRESILDLGLLPTTTADDLPVGAKRTSRAAPVDVAPKAHRRTSSFGPVNVLPPRQKPAAEPQPAPRTVTYEELLERHQAKMRSLQEPISRQEKEQAELEAARGRWERSKNAEKEAQARKQTEKESTLAKKTREDPRRPRETPGEGSTRPTGGRRASTGKVLEWQRYQQEVGVKDPNNPSKVSPRRRGHPPAEQGGLPFPNTTPRGASTTDKRRSRSGIPPS